ATLINSRAPRCSIGGDAGITCTLRTIAGALVTGPVSCPAGGTFTAPALATGTTYSLAVQAPGGLVEPRVFTVNFTPPTPPAITSPPNGGLAHGAPLLALSGPARTHAR